LNTLTSSALQRKLINIEL